MSAETKMDSNLAHLTVAEIVRKHMTKPGVPPVEAQVIADLLCDLKNNLVETSEHFYADGAAATSGVAVGESAVPGARYRVGEVVQIDCPDAKKAHGNFTEVKEVKPEDSGWHYWCEGREGVGMWGERWLKPVDLKSLPPRGYSLGERDEAWCHAACLSIAEGRADDPGVAQVWEEKDLASPAMVAVLGLRRDYLAEKKAVEQLEAALATQHRVRKMSEKMSTLWGSVERPLIVRPSDEVDVVNHIVGQLSRELAYWKQPWWLRLAKSMVATAERWWSVEPAVSKIGPSMVFGAEPLGASRKVRRAVVDPAPFPESLDGKPIERGVDGSEKKS